MIDALLVRGRFVAARRFSYSIGAPGPGPVERYDLGRGTRRTVCRGEYGVGDFTLAGDGTMTCA